MNDGRVTSRENLFLTPHVFNNKNNPLKSQIDSRTLEPRNPKTSFFFFKVSRTSKCGPWRWFSSRPGRYMIPSTALYLMKVSGENILLLYYIRHLFLDATTHLYRRSCPSVRRSVRPSVPCYFRKAKIVDFKDGKSSNNIINNATMNDDEVVASYGPPRSLLTLLNDLAFYCRWNHKRGDLLDLLFIMLFYPLSCRTVARGHAWINSAFEKRYLRWREDSKWVDNIHWITAVPKCEWVEENPRLI